jgi:hypothetical protein
MCFISSILLLRNNSTKYWKYFILYLATTVTIESYSFVANRCLFLNIDTQWLYNIFLLIYMVFHIYIFYKIINIHYIKNICIFCLLLLLGFYGWEFYNIGFLKYFSRTNTMFSGVVILLSILYYYSLFKHEEIKDIMCEPAFWFVSGCLIFYVTSSVTNAFFKEIIEYSRQNSFPLRYVIMNFLNIIMYGCWIKSFICLHKAQASSAHLS